MTKKMKLMSNERIQEICTIGIEAGYKNLAKTLGNCQEFMQSVDSNRRQFFHALDQALVVAHEAAGEARKDDEGSWHSDNYTMAASIFCSWQDDIAHIYGSCRSCETLAFAFYIGTVRSKEEIDYMVDVANDYT